MIPGVTDVAEDSLSAQSLIYTDQYGRKIIRPCGLSDQVGNAAGAGATAALIGLAWALRPIGLMKRLACAGLAFCGVAVIYYSQVRMTFLMLIICLVVLVVIFMAQKNFGYATLLGGLGAAMIVGALSWVMATSGRVVVERFLGLASRTSARSYEESGRSEYVKHALEVMIWEHPLGQGLGRWGATFSAFGDRSRGSIWVEVMINAWVVDGGIPLLVLYNLAVVLAHGQHAPDRAAVAGPRGRLLGGGDLRLGAEHPGDLLQLRDVRHRDRPAVLVPGGRRPRRRLPRPPRREEAARAAAAGPAAPPTRRRPPGWPPARPARPPAPAAP